ncbi:hypothetical protein ACFXEL_07130 [Streptomyces sp. NPDC059382]
MNGFEGGDGRYLEMTNGGTAVFVDVLMLTVSSPSPRRPANRGTSASPPC